MSDIEKAINYLKFLKMNCITPSIEIKLDTAIESLKEKAERENPKPLTVEELKEYINRPIWHKSLQGNESKWVILQWNVAKYPKEYHYGENWIAYKYEPKEDK